MKRVLRGFGLMSILIGTFFLIGSSPRVTGFVIAEEIGAGIGSVLGIFLVVAGIFMIAVSREDEGGLEKRTLKAKKQLEVSVKGGKVGDYDELRHLASKLGYTLEEAGKHTKVYHGRRLVTVIPRGTSGRDVRTGTYKKIAKDLYREAA